ncbi:MAG: type II toxin-antitoxin system RelE/ParE family toxin [Helicobacteraceae bacterium]|jgi:mRNA interferase RelE/StbE|nr:type II toxin-antitoxin system RelE/ParE family toxin [Helicobacteraceae bacterium]
MFKLPPEPPLDLYWHDDAGEDIAQLNESARRRIIKALRKYVEVGTPRPKPLTGELAGFWKIRIGDYRAIVKFYDQINNLPKKVRELIGDNKKFVFVSAIGHRSEIYKNRK